MKQWVVFVVGLMLIASVVAEGEAATADSPLVAWLKKVFKPTTSNVEAPSPSLSATRPIASTDVVSIRNPTASNVKRPAVWCSALKGVFTDYYKTGLYVGVIDVNDDGKVAYEDYQEMQKYYKAGNSNTVSAWCQKQFTKPARSLSAVKA